MSLRIGQVFHLVLVKPSHHDDEGCPIRWLRSAKQSNTLAYLNDRTDDAARRQIPESDVEIRIHTLDETNNHIRVQKIADMIIADGGIRADAAQHADRKAAAV